MNGGPAAKLHWPFLLLAETCPPGFEHPAFALGSQRRALRFWLKHLSWGFYPVSTDTFE